MNLKDYISEAVSHGGNAKYSNEPEYGDSTDDIINWLKSYGINGYQWKDKDRFRYMEGNPPVKYGELIWYAGPCDRSLVIARLVACHAIPNVGIASRYGVVSRLSGKHRDLHHISRIAGSTAIDCLIADVISIIYEWYIIVVQLSKLTR